jgi:hypothetical protein
MTYSEKIRVLAQTNYWQCAYRASKDCGIKLFHNDTDLSGIQIAFLHWLETYSSLYKELGSFEDKYLTENVIKDSVRCDAYLYRRRKENEFEWKNLRIDEQARKSKNKNPNRKNSTGKESFIGVDLRTK